jgi:hypothetical protein
MTPTTPWRSPRRTTSSDLRPVAPAAAEEAEHGALYRYELTGELYDDDEIRRFYQAPIEFECAAPLGGTGIAEASRVRWPISVPRTDTPSRRKDTHRRYWSLTVRSGR